MGAAALVGSAALFIGHSQPSRAAFPGRSFGCSNPGAGLQTYPGSANALIATPNGSLIPTQTTVAIFGDVFQWDGTVVTGETRCLRAMLVLNGVNGSALVGTVAVTYEFLTNGHSVTGAKICLVPIAQAGARDCGEAMDATNAAPPAPGRSYVLFAVSQSSTPAQTAANIAGILNAPFVPGVAPVSGRVDGRSRI